MVMLRCVNTTFDECHTDFFEVFSPAFSDWRLTSVDGTIVRSVMALDVKFHDVLPIFF